MGTKQRICQARGCGVKGRGVAGDNEPHGRKEERSEEGEMGGQEETFELWNGVRLVGMRQPELEGHKRVAHHQHGSAGEEKILQPPRLTLGSRGPQ